MLRYANLCFEYATQSCGPILYFYVCDTMVASLISLCVTADLIVLVRIDWTMQYGWHKQLRRNVRWGGGIFRHTTCPLTMPVLHCPRILEQAVTHTSA